MEGTKLEERYALMINDHLAEMFNEDNSNYLGADILTDPEKATAFIHALANLVPANFYNKITEQTIDMLAFNHVANTLCFQYAKLAEDGI